jgi:pimeloyl-ACP methyl ester carboxylesterase
MKEQIRKMSFLCLGLASFWVWISVEGSLIRQAAAAEKELLPIVFVPGTAGSELRMDDDANTVYWVNAASFQHETLLKGELNSDGTDTGRPRLIATQPLMSFASPLTTGLEKGLSDVGFRVQVSYEVPVYDRFLGWAKIRFGRWRWFEAPYDWRKGACDENSRAIDEVVERAKKLSGREKVILVAHSLGGLVCRDYLAGRGKGKVESLIAVGTPWLGAPKTARALLWGFGFGAGLTLIPFGGNDMFSLYIYIKEYPGPGKTSRVSPYPIRISFIAEEDAIRLARSFPCVFQQLPTEEFMAFYGKASGLENQSKSVVFGTGSAQMREDLKRLNPVLFKNAEDWRRARLGNNAYGVKHFLIGAVCANLGDRVAFTDMQMAQPGSLTASGPSAADRIRDFGNSNFLSFRDGVVKNLRSNGYPVFVDRYVAVDSAADWGDGTSPLLSATAGAQLRMGFPLPDTIPDNAKAEPFLGPGVQVTSLILSPGYEHGSMLADPVVQKELLRIVREVDRVDRASVKTPVQ